VEIRSALALFSSFPYIPPSLSDSDADRTELLLVSPTSLQVALKHPDPATIPQLNLPSTNKCMKRLNFPFEKVRTLRHLAIV
jgi:hypothetical protein